MKYTSHCANKFDTVSFFNQLAIEADKADLFLGPLKDRNFQKHTTIQSIMRISSGVSRVGYGIVLGKNGIFSVGIKSFDSSADNARIAENFISTKEQDELKLGFNVKIDVTKGGLGCFSVLSSHAFLDYRKDEHFDMVAKAIFIKLTSFANVYQHRLRDIVG